MPDKPFRELTITAPRGVRSLAWDDGQLVDWAAGGGRYFLDGSVQQRSVSYSFPFDACVVSPTGSYSVIYTSIGTKGLVLNNGEIVRQINRDFYHAHAYTYPITFGIVQGREVLIHCPEHYCQIEIEDVETGESLTACSERKSRNVFHSRLLVSPNGKWLMSAGWVWHPLDIIELYDLPAALVDPTTLESKQESPPGMWEMSAATFMDDDKLMVASSDEFYGDDDDDEDNQPGKNRIAIWTIGASDYSDSASLDEPPGTIMPVGEHFAISFFRHPKLIDLKTGQIIQTWPHIDSGKQTSSITWDKPPPPIAIDVVNARFAVGSSKSIHVVELYVERLEKYGT